VSVSCYTKRIMVARTPRTHAATVEPASKTVRTPRVPKAKNTPRYADTESPTASAAARNILAEHALFTARMREHTRHEAEPSRYAFPLSPHPLFSGHASFDIERPLGTHRTSHKNPFAFLLTLSWRLNFVLLAVLALGGGAFYRFTRDAPEDTPASIADNIRAHVSGVADEVPTVYRVTDAAKIAAQGGLFKKLIEGDAILEYTKAELVVFYRSSENKIIAVFSTAAGE